MCPAWSSEPSAIPVQASDDAGMSVGAAVALGAVIGLALGILISLTTDVPLAPEGGLVLGAAVGWVARRDHA
jgi:hypothetical protein